MKTKYGSLQEMIIDRNRRLKEFFTSRNIDVELIGDINQPVVIVKNFSSLFAVGAHVKNFKYNFTDIPFNGSIVKTIDLTEDNSNITEDTILDLFERYQQRDVFVLKKHKTKSLLFHSVAQKNDSQHVYWSETDPHYFLSLQKAEEKMSELYTLFNIKTVIEPEQE